MDVCWYQVCGQGIKDEKEVRVHVSKPGHVNFESMTIMCWNNRQGFVGYTPKEIHNMASSGRSVAIYRGLVYDVMDYVQFPPATRALSGQQAPQVDVNFMDSGVLDPFKFNSGSDIMKELDNLNVDSNVLSAQKVCLRNLFTTSKVDNRNSPNAYSQRTFYLPSWFSWSASLEGDPESQDTAIPSQATDLKRWRSRLVRVLHRKELRACSRVPRNRRRW